MSPGKQASQSEAAAVNAAGARLEAMRRRVRFSRVAVWTVIAAGPITLCAAATSTPTTVAAAPTAEPTTVRTATSATDPSGYAQVFISAWHTAADGCHWLKPEQVAAEKSVADQVDRAQVLAHGVNDVTGEVAGDTDQTRAAPQDLGRGCHPEAVVDQMLELGAMVHQPRQVEKVLVDDAGVDAALVLDFTDRRSSDTYSELR
jgi:hypothetical protein